jgi:uncharacterized surface protein with fasciclin (FAS1) repeats
MHFYNSVKALNKFTGIAAALLILPIAVACGSQTGDTTAEVPQQATETVPAPVPAATPEATTSTTEGGTIVDVAISNGSFDTLVAAIQAADLATTLSGTGPFTVFAPTDEAFAALPQGTLEKLLLPKNKEALAKILTYHVVSGEVLSSDIKAGAVATVEGEEVDIAVAAGKVTVNTATVTQPDVTASNGVIHVIDTVLLPPDVDLATL